MTGFNFGQQQAQTLSENEVLGKIDGIAAAHLLHIYTKSQEYQKFKPMEGADALEKSFYSMEDDMVRAITHTLASLAEEVDHGNATIAEARDELEAFQRDYTSFRRAGSFPRPFVSRFISNLEKKAKMITSATSVLDQCLQQSVPAQSTRTLIQTLEAQHDAIVRCASRVSAVREFADQLLERSKSLGDIAGSEDKGRSSVSIVLEDYRKYQGDRRRALEKRDTTTDFHKFYNEDDIFGIGIKF